ncbi:MAG: hypothetical protein GY827_08265, partial [Cytophagales bacterium]|nr:hypothetical protein [Cytophagales bacterium]
MVKKITLLGCMAVSAVQGFSQVVINEIQPSTNTVELKNTGTTAVDVSDWFLCSIEGGADYGRVDSYDLVSGDLDMAPGSIVVLSGRNMNASNDELGLYNSNSFSSSSAIKDYIQWGQVNKGRSGVAESAGIWIASEALPSLTGSQGFEFDGDGNALTDYRVTEKPNFGQENKNTCSFGVSKGGMVTTEGGDTQVITPTGTDLAKFSVKNTSVAGLSYWYIITDADDNILDWVNSNGEEVTDLDLSGAPNGECHIWGWSYKGLSDPVVGEHISTLNDDACEDISDNWITVIRETPNGGMVTTEGGDTQVITPTGTDLAKFSVKN